MFLKLNTLYIFLARLDILMYFIVNLEKEVPRLSILLGWYTFLWVNLYTYIRILFSIDQ